MSKVVHPKQVDFNLVARSVLEDIPHLKHKILKATSSPDKCLNPAFAETLKFMWLSGYHQRKLTPSMRVDTVWHEFILFTKYYSKFCQEHFGRYVHHSPGGDGPENALAFRKTLHLYRLHFGDPPEAYWGDCQEVSCGSCQS